jgi:hypothetical protein
MFVFILTFSPIFSFSQNEPQLTGEQKEEFLAKAKVIGSKKLNVGVTASYRLTLSDGKITHDAHFQSINERRSFKQLQRGSEVNFVDSYLYNIAAYELAKLLDLDGMLPVTVRRDWKRNTGALAWWIPSKMTIGEKERKKLDPPDIDAWSRSMYKIRVFTELIYDTDRSNPGNILIGNDWELYMIDFTRSFRLYHNIQNPKNLVCCSRALLKKLRDLDGLELAAHCGKYLNKLELEGVMLRRDKIVGHFEKLISEKGENAVLY